MTGPTVAELLATVRPPKGRADLTSAQKIALAQVIATADLAREQHIANVLHVLSGSHALIEHDSGVRASTDVTRARVAWRNDLREQVRGWLDITEGIES